MKVRSSRVGPAAVYFTAVIHTLTDDDAHDRFLYLGGALILVVAAVLFMERFVLDHRDDDRDP